MRPLFDADLLALLGSAMAEDSRALSSVYAAIAGQVIAGGKRRPVPVAAVDASNPLLKPSSGSYMRSADLLAAIRKLPPAQQTVVRLCFLEHHSSQEAAAICGMSHDEIKALQYSALSALSSLLRPKN